MRRFLLAAAILIVVPRFANADPDLHVDRLVSVGKAWSAIRWLHPYLFDRDVDWDAALVHAIPKINAAKSPDEYAAAVDGMLTALRDPLTHTVREEQVAAPTTGADGALFERREQGLVVVPFPTGARAAKDYQLLRKALLDAHDVIFDLRAPRPPSVGRLFQMLEAVQDALPTHECAPPARRRVQHSGFVTQSGRTSGGYYSEFALELPPVYQPAAGSKPKRVAFLVNKNSPVPPIAIALQSVGDGIVVAQGPVTEENLWDNQDDLPLGEGWRVAIRTVELTDAALRFDVQLPPATESSLRPDDPGIKAALLALRKPARPLPATPNTAPPPKWRRDRAYQTMEYPSVEYRLLALFRVWAAIHFFYPYSHLLDGSWDDVLREFIPKLEAARDATEYGLALAELSTHVPDGHTGLWGSRALRKWFGEAMPPLVVRVIEGQPVIVGLRDASAARAGPPSATSS